MRKLKYVKLFENFQFQYFKPEDIKKLNDDLYNNEDFSYIDYLIEHWIEEFARVIKSVEPFKNIKEIEVDVNNGSIKVDWNNYCRPFTIYFSSCGRIGSGYEEYEGISIRFDCSEDDSYPDTEDLSTHKHYGGKNYVEYHFKEGEDSDTLYSRPDWDDDAIPILFRNIEKSIYK
jgi:hypothetical protein